MKDWVKARNNIIKNENWYFKWDTRYKWYQIQNRNEIKTKNITKIPMFRKVVKSVEDIVSLFESACNDPTYKGLFKKIKEV